MRIVFLDVDGVLNCTSTKDKFEGFTGIDDRFTANLKTLIDKSNEKDETNIVMSSSWRIGQERNTIEKIPKDYTYLTEKLALQGLTIYDDTPRFNWWGTCYNPRGREITAWLYQNRNKNITGYVVIDDERFHDFKKYGITKRFVQTSWRGDGGFREKHIKKALSLLDIPYNFYKPEKEGRLYIKLPTSLKYISVDSGKFNAYLDNKEVFDIEEFEYDITYNINPDVEIDGKVENILKDMSEEEISKEADDFISSKIEEYER